MVSMRPEFRSVLDELLVRHRASGVVDLNDIAEVIGARAASYEDVEALIDALEAAGLQVAEEARAPQIALAKQVLALALQLKGRLGRRPTVEELAAETGRPAHEVRRALEWAGRPGRIQGALSPRSKG